MATKQETQTAVQDLQARFNRFASHFHVTMTRGQPDHFFVAVSDGDNAPEEVRSMLAKGSVSGHSVFIKREENIPAASF